MRVFNLAMALLLTAPALGGCISKSKHDRLLADAENRLADTEDHYRRQVSLAQSELTKLQGKVKELEKTVSGLETAVADRDKRIVESNTQAATLERRLDDAIALSEQLRGELERAGRNVTKLVSERGRLHEALEATKSRLEELRTAQAAADKRARAYRELLLKFKRMTDAGDLEIVIRDGRMVLQLANDVLFDSGRTELKPEGGKALKEVARILAGLAERKLQVAGHTDDVPISTERFPSNWELSTARALVVVKFLIENGVAATSLSVAGYSKYDPVFVNDTVEGKARNRRIEIVIQPDIAELVKIPELG